MNGKKDFFTLAANRNIWFYTPICCGKTPDDKFFAVWGQF
ncbi:hypothetical protein HDG70_001389 [Carboxydothermus ferrireducens DSM 11255]|uniref:Uncharacterized protein n=1 Tax=Carboxydothermus ferrireducens DSM 11255 TaxID=1119529 RepID=A0ABX2R929_9THEO|nr:hypothetical protein [Carboxydothermus ferrireducens DSM 11255]